MRKSVVLFAITALFILFSSSHKVQEIGLKVDAFIPELTIVGQDSVLDLNQERGNFILVNFWTSENAVSRIRNIEYDNVINNLENKNLKFASINYDRSYNLYSEIINNDEVLEESQFFDYDGINSEVYKEFQLERGFNSYLVNKEGKIIAINPKAEQLTSLVCQ